MEIMGLPLHPLVVHAVVVLVPLSALGGIVISAWTAARKRYGWLTVAFAAAAAASTFVAEQAGEAFAATFARKTEALETHINLGGTLLVWVVILFVGTAAVMFAQRLIDQQNPRGRVVLIAGGVITVISAVVSIVQVVRIGHSGSAAVWMLKVHGRPDQATALSSLHRFKESSS
jgi:uncharacterized membrane protein